VASGKGGVGKSTTAVNLAVAATALGLRVGLLDADVYGPSLPLLMGLPAGVPPRLDQQKRLVPPVPHGVATMSMGLLLKGAPRSAWRIGTRADATLRAPLAAVATSSDGAAAAWRGPMVMGALEKLIRGTAWPELDLLLIDMPPGAPLPREAWK
jgi:ATP-binding protein involved in chromosome partitioning